MENGNMPAMPVHDGDGEPAPFDCKFYRNKNLATGLTKREEFAKAAMAGLLAAPDIRSGVNPDALALAAVTYADKILDALERTKCQS